MYAIKDSMIAKEHAHGDLDCVVFNMDIRSFGKDYEKYYNRAKDAGIRFVKCRVHSLDVMRETGDLAIRYVDESGNLLVEVFDMVVLSVGLQVPESTGELAKRLGIDVDKSRFAVTHPFAPIETSRKGVYACGVFQGPKDIPSSVTEASAAACAAAARLSSGRNTLTRRVEIPEEIDVSGEPPRIGVFVCNCGINIGGVVNVKEVEEYAQSLPGVAFSTQNLFTCSQDSQEQMKAIIRDNRLNRVVVAACSPKTHQPIFQDTLTACGLNKHLFDMANIRNQDSWVHSGEPQAATRKAKDLVRMAVARAATLNSIKGKVVPINKKALVIGGGIAGMNAALSLADQGFPVVLVEKQDELGGFARNLQHTIEGEDIQKYLRSLVSRVKSSANLEVLTNTLVAGFSGFKGNFATDVLVGPELKPRSIDHGAVILATGGTEYRPKEYFYGEDPRVMTQVELSQRLHRKDLGNPQQVLMIQCIGSRNEENPNCSRICCQTAVKNALAIKEAHPDTDVFILYRDIRTYGLMEEYYTEARRRGVLFFRFEPDNPPKAQKTDEGIEVTFTDHILQRPLAVTPDILVLSAGLQASDTSDLSAILKAARTQEGFFMEAHVKLRPVDMAADGFYVCGTAHGPKLISETISQARAAAARAGTLLALDSVTLSAITAKVITEYCVKCLTCVRSCPFGVPQFNTEEKVIEINEALCRGCGVCTAVCPRQTINLSFYEDDQIMCKIDALLAEEVK